MMFYTVPFSGVTSSKEPRLERVAEKVNYLTICSKNCLDCQFKIREKTNCISRLFCRVSLLSYVVVLER